MGIWHERSKRKASGGLLKRNRKSRRFSIGREPTKTTIGQKKIKKVRTKGGNIKNRLRFTEVANVLNPKTKKYSISKILDVVENKANLHFIRQKVITKGAVLKTELGNVKVTSRPSQDGTVNSVLIEEKK